MNKQPQGGWVGKTVQLKSGKTGTVISGQDSIGRYKVQYEARKNPRGYPLYQCVLVRAENLRLV